MEKLLCAAVADADVIVRHSIFSSLYGNVGFDDFLAQADSLTAIFAALNDEVYFLLIFNVQKFMSKYFELLNLLKADSLVVDIFCNCKPFFCLCVVLAGYQLVLIMRNYINDHVLC